MFDITKEMIDVRISITEFRFLIVWFYDTLCLPEEWTLSMNFQVREALSILLEAHLKNNDIELSFEATCVFCLSPTGN